MKKNLILVTVFVTVLLLSQKICFAGGIETDWVTLSSATITEGLSISSMTLTATGVGYGLTVSSGVLLGSGAGTSVTNINSSIQIPSGSISDGGTSNTVVGQVTSAGGNNTVVVNNSLVKTTSVVLVSPDSNPGVSWYVTPAAGSFTITGSGNITNGVVFSWILIN